MKKEVAPPTTVRVKVPTPVKRAESLQANNPFSKDQKRKSLDPNNPFASANLKKAPANATNPFTPETARRAAAANPLVARLGHINMAKKTATPNAPSSLSATEEAFLRAATGGEAPKVKAKTPMPAVKTNSPAPVAKKTETSNAPSSLSATEEAFLRAATGGEAPKVKAKAPIPAVKTNAPAPAVKPKSPAPTPVVKAKSPAPAPTVKAKAPAVNTRTATVSQSAADREKELLGEVIYTVACTNMLYVCCAGLFLVGYILSTLTHVCWVHTDVSLYAIASMFDYSLVTSTWWCPCSCKLPSQASVEDTNERLKGMAFDFSFGSSSTDPDTAASKSASTTDSDGLPDLPSETTAATNATPVAKKVAPQTAPKISPATLRRTALASKADGGTADKDAAELKDKLKRRDEKAKKKAEKKAELLALQSKLAAAKKNSPATVKKGAPLSSREDAFIAAATGKKAAPAVAAKLKSPAKTTPAKTEDPNQFPAVQLRKSLKSVKPNPKTEVHVLFEHPVCLKQHSKQAMRATSCTPFLCAEEGRENLLLFPPVGLCGHEVIGKLCGTFVLTIWRAHGLPLRCILFHA